MDRHEVAFFGKISAAMTHDIRNVLAIIRESSGLMLDLLDLCDDGSFRYQQKFNSLLTAIQDQVNRGVELSTHFNRFAHSMDVEVADVDGNAMVQQIVFLMQRFARLRRVQLVAAVAEPGVALRTDAFALHRLLGECVGLLLEHTAEGDAITVKADKGPGGVEFSTLINRPGLFPDCPADSVPEVFAEVTEYLRSRGGGLKWITTADGNGVAMTLPSSLPVAL
jgi:signal transduction histidine kinase